MDRQTHGWMRWRCRDTMRKMDGGQVDRWIDAIIDEWMNGQIVGWIDRWMDR